MVTIESKGILHFDPDHYPVTQRCLPVKGITNSLPDRPFFILVTNTATKYQLFEKRKVLGNLNDDISTMISAEAPQKPPKDEQALPSVVGTIRTEEK